MILAFNWFHGLRVELLADQWMGAFCSAQKHGSASKIIPSVDVPVINLIPSPITHIYDHASEAKVMSDIAAQICIDDTPHKTQTQG